MGIGFGAVESLPNPVQYMERHRNPITFPVFLHRYLSLTYVGRGAVGYKTRVFPKGRWNQRFGDFRTPRPSIFVDGFFCCFIWRWILSCIDEGGYPKCTDDKPGPGQRL